MILFYYGKFVFVEECPPSSGGHFFLKHAEWTKIKNKSPEAVTTFLNVKQALPNAELL